MGRKIIIWIAAIVQCAFFVGLGLHILSSYDGWQEIIGWACIILLPILTLVSERKHLF